MQTNPIVQLYRIALLAFLVVLFGVMGYRATSGLGWLDALYMTVITLSTVGYREVGPGLDDSGKIFTVVLILGGAGVLAYSVKTAIEIVLDDATRHYFQQRSNLRRLDKLKDHYIVCGLGRVGRAVCEELAQEKLDFVFLDSDEQSVKEATERGWSGLLGDATEDRILIQAGIERAKGLMCCVRTDADNLMTIVTARGLVEELPISARVSDERNLEKFRRAGAVNIYSPFSLVGRRLARAMTQPRVSQLLDLAFEQANYDLTISEYPVPAHSDLVGKTLVESGFRGRFGAVILALIREDRSILHNPAIDTLFRANDILVVLGTPTQLKALTHHADK